MGFRGRIVRLSQLIADSITGAAINGGTITGALFRTAATGKRWEISSAPSNVIKGYSGLASETGYGRVTVDVIGSSAQVSMSPPQFQTGSIDGFSQWPILSVSQDTNTFFGIIQHSADRHTWLAYGAGANGAGATMALTETGLQVNNKTVATLDSVYPVGSIYLSMNSANPSTLFGGTWARIAVGRMLVGIDPGDADFNAPGNFGGEKAHTLTDAELPNHNYVIHPSGATTYYFNQGTSTTDRAAQFAGGGQAHNNMPPYLACYIWQRTA